MVGKNIRLNRFRFPQSKNGLIVPLDHGLTLGPLAGIGSIREMSAWITHPSICGVKTHKGIAERLIDARLLDGKGLMIHLNGMSTLASDPDTKERMTSMESAVRLGADGVSFQVNFTGKNDSQNLKLMGQIVDEASQFALPVLAMVYDKVDADAAKSIERLRHLLRAAIELGCDAVKIAPPDDRASLPAILAGIAEDISIFLAGGSPTNEQALYDLTRAGLRAGAAGLCVGRNVFQRENFSDVLQNLQEILSVQSNRISEVPFERGIAYGPH